MPSSVRVATLPFGTVVVDCDGEMLMSLGFCETTDGVVDIAFINLASPPTGFMYRYVPPQMLNKPTAYGQTRYAVQEDSIPEFVEMPFTLPRSMTVMP
jgi:hypothetical protein